MNERSFQIDGISYQLSKVDAFQQLYIVKRMAPLFGEIIGAMKSVAPILDKKDVSEEDRWDMLAEVATPVFTGFSKIPDEDAKYILTGLLASVEMQQPEFAGVWARLAVSGKMMFNDIDLPTMLKIAGRAFMFNVGNFSRALHQTSEGQKSKQKGK